jgi:hypothetical protein
MLSSRLLNTHLPGIGGEFLLNVLCRNENSLMLLMGMQIFVVTMEFILVVPQKVKHRIIIYEFL